MAGRHSVSVRKKGLLKTVRSRLKLTESQRKSPLELSRGVGTTEADPVGGCETEPHKLRMKTGNHASLVRGRDLAVVDGNRHVHHADREAPDDPAGNEHPDVDRSGLNDTSDQSDDGGDEDGDLSTVVVGAPAREKYAEDGAPAEGADDGTFDAWGEGSKIFEKRFMGDGGGDDPRVNAVEKRPDLFSQFSTIPSFYHLCRFSHSSEEGAPPGVEID